MKNTIVILLLLLGFEATAQYTIPVEQMVTYLINQNSHNHYFKDVNGVFDKFVGHWKYETPTHKLEIEIFKLEHINYGGGTRYEDEIELKCRYTQNGVVVFDTYTQSMNTFFKGLYFNIPNNSNIYRFSYREPGQDTQGQRQYMDLEYLPAASGGQPQLHWVVYSELSAAAGENPPQMPMDMVLNKLP